MEASEKIKIKEKKMFREDLKKLLGKTCPCNHISLSAGGDKSAVQ